MVENNNSDKSITDNTTKLFWPYVGSTWGIISLMIESFLVIEIWHQNIDTRTSTCTWNTMLKFVFGDSKEYDY